MNYLDRFANDLRGETKAIYLYGAGFIADKVFAFLKERDVEIAGYLVDKKYLPEDGKNREKNGFPIVAADELEEACVLIDAIRLNDAPISPPRNKFIQKVYRLDFSSCFLHGLYDEGFVFENRQGLSRLYERLYDVESRIAMANFVTQKITGWHCKPKSNRTQYFDEDIFLPQENEVVVDCGAYDGDTFRAFLAFLTSHDITSWRRYFALEPDGDNFRKLEASIAGYSNISAYQLGVYRGKDILHFSDGKDTGSSIQSDGESSIEVDSIDNIVGDEEVTYIKMDIEGAELEALQGAQNTILKCRPKLAICVYHKAKDLLSIPDFILSLHDDYRLYLRNYKNAGVETVLYAL